MPFLETGDLNQLFVLIIVGVAGIVILIVALIVYIIFSSSKGKEETQASEGPGTWLSLLRPEGETGLIVEVRGKRYARLEDIKDEQTRHQVLQAATELMKFAGIGASAPASSEAKATSQELRPARSSKGMLRFIEGGPPQRQSPDKTPVFKPPPEKKGAPSIGGFFSQALKPPKTEETPRSFIDEIEAILQELIARAPAPLEKKIHVRAGPSGALQIEVDGKFFDRADEIPDPVARELIKIAVKRWEKSK